MPMNNKQTVVDNKILLMLNFICMFSVQLKNKILRLGDPSLIDQFSGQLSPVGKFMIKKQISQPYIFCVIFHTLAQLICPKSSKFLYSRYSTNYVFFQL